MLKNKSIFSFLKKIMFWRIYKIQKIKNYLNKENNI